MSHRPARAVALSVSCVLCVLSGSLSPAGAEDPKATMGWRGNWTGLYPEAQAPAEWSNISAGPMQGMKCTTTQPADGSDKDAKPVDKGLVTDWLVIGPFKLDDGTKDFAKELIADEANLAPVIGDKAGDLQWRFTQPASDSVSFQSFSVLDGKSDRNLAGYAHTRLYAPTAGKVRAVFEHVVGMKMYVNGKEVYSEPLGRTVMGSAYGQSKSRIASTHPVAPSAEFDVQQGWNRLTVKLVAPNKGGWNDLRLFLRLSDVAGAKYDRKNIVWATPLPDRGNANPIIVGDRIFLTAEPDELICIDKNSGKVLWNAMNTYFEAAPQADRDANPAFKDKLEPLARLLKEETDPVKRAAHRKALQDGLAAIDKKRYAMDFDGHMAAHFEIVGFSTAAGSDGKFVYVWTGSGVAACYDLDGKRQWIRRIEGKLNYPASPALVGGKFVVFFQHMYGLDARTGQIAWEQPEVNSSFASLIAARLGDTDVVISQKGDVVRVSDGKVLWANPAKSKQDTGWCAPAVSGDVLYVPWFGISQVFAVDFAGCSGDEWKPKVRTIRDITKGVPREKGDQGDPHMAASPLIHDGLLYAIDIHGRYYVVDIQTGKRLTWKKLDFFNGDSNYVALSVAASPTLVGKHIVVLDNQGHAVTLEPGGQAKEIARNNLATQLQRDWPITTIDYTYSAPVSDGKRMYLRGERYLYCIGQK